MTNDEIKAKLEGLGVGFPKNAKKQELEGLLDEALGCGEEDGGAPDEPFAVAVIPPALNVRSGPDARAGVLRVVHGGDELSAASEGGGWVEVAGGGFVMAEFVERIG